MDEGDVPDLAGAEVYVEAAERPITGGGRWYVLPGDRVVYQRPTSEIYEQSIIAAHTLRSSPTWRRLPAAAKGG